MHQPDYRNSLDGQFELPWTYLHAIKDYTDMAWHLEQHPDVACVVNFTPSLVEQLEDYCNQFKTGAVRDPLLSLLARPTMEGLSGEERHLILSACYRSNFSKMIEPFPAYHRLYHTFTELTEQDPALQQYLSNQYLADLLVWYHLAWMGESVRRANELVQRLMKQGSLFTDADRRALYELVGELIRHVIPRYRALQLDARIELSATPFYHPILPLLLDFASAREAMPEIDLPTARQYPGGLQRAQEQVRHGLARHMHYFGQRARGVWPAEGGVSGPTLEVLAGQDCQWTATGESVLVNSLSRDRADPLPDRSAYLYHPYRYRTAQGELTCFFRDDRLSDKIGFEYATWDSSDAVGDFINALEGIYAHADDATDPVVSIILDGENAWEYYPYNGYYFLSNLYQVLQDHPFIVTTTFSECASEARIVAPVLDSIVSGSWVYGTFSTWIGNPDKNAAWDLLVEAKQHYDRVVASGLLTPDEHQQATRQLSICEGSDWFWWFGDYNVAESVRSFDRLYRLNLSNLYALLHLQAPEVLLQPVSVGSHKTDAGGAMRRATE